MDQWIQDIENTITSDQVQAAAEVSEELATGRPWQFVMIAFEQD